MSVSNTQSLRRKAYVIVFGNEKGGTGKSTIAMHVIVDLLQRGYTVLSLDCDGRQATLTHYVENRQRYSEEQKLPLSRHHNIKTDSTESTDDLLDTLIAQAVEDFVVIDTPGNDTALSRRAHTFADLLITPLNDSYIDIDLLVRIDGLKTQQLRPSVYAHMVWEQRLERASEKKPAMEWIVVKNRVSSVRSKNREQLENILVRLAPRLGFRLGQGFHERAIFRQLFPYGLTISDRALVKGDLLSMAHIAARQELRGLMSLILSSVTSAPLKSQTRA